MALRANAGERLERIRTSADVVCFLKTWQLELFSSMSHPSARSSFLTFRSITFCVVLKAPPRSSTISWILTSDVKVAAATNCPLADKEMPWFVRPDESSAASSFPCELQRAAGKSISRQQCALADKML